MVPSEQELIEGAKAGDAAALEALLATHAPAVFRFGQKMCREPEDAKDVLQEAQAVFPSVHVARDFDTYSFKQEG